MIAKIEGGEWVIKVHLLLKGSYSVEDSYKDGGHSGGGGCCNFFLRDCSLKCREREKKIEKLCKVSFPTAHACVCEVLEKTKI